LNQRDLASFNFKSTGVMLVRSLESHLLSTGIPQHQSKDHTLRDVPCSP
jgi:hypothetical protein